MSVVITKEDLKAYAEVDYIIKHVNERYRSKVPQNLLDFFETMKDPNHEVRINPYQPLQNQGLTKYTLEIIALLHIKYWCENQERKAELLEKMKENQERLEAKLKEQFSADNLFEKKVTPIEITEDEMVRAYTKYTDTNPDIQDYTDFRKEFVPEELAESVPAKTSFFQKLKSFFSGIFKKH